MILKQAFKRIILLALVHRVTTKECSIKNITCKDIQTRAGHRFLLEPENKMVTDIDIIQTENETLIAHQKNGGKWKTSPEVVNSDPNSITTRSCRSIQVKFIYSETTNSTKISESCQTYNIIGPNSPTSLASSTCPYWLGIVVTLLVLLAAAIVHFFWWRRKQKEKGLQATPSHYLYQLKSCLLKKRENSDSHVNQSDEENNHNSQREQQQLLDGTGGHAASNRGISDVSINVEPDENLKADGKSTAQVNGVKDLNGNMGHDPGGGKAELHCHGNNQKHGLGLQTLGEQSFSSDNGCLLSLNQGSAREEASDETAGDEGQRLVNSSGPGNERIDPPDGEKDIHKIARKMLNNS